MHVRDEYYKLMINKTDFLIQLTALYFDNNL